ncbi:unnamed protein product [Peronospora belbahrii]|uniref:IMS import disulfide relay-system CHCH-CHCH-like Cx9C domain-containing protein n=1 Tax=Peronospora belbahrii TaxID=622444 RepID=A0AAU9L5V2_9STRA|nr:unnamed protein product [Peronospora belbahrii]CAH0521003.1 unnamed protein product [Peronospora belbahrii]
MNDAILPQCMSTMRLHEMLLDGTLGESEDHALMTDRRLSGKYQGLRSCDKAFNALLNTDKLNANLDDSSSTGATSHKPSQVLYAEYLNCVSRALCKRPLLEWVGCRQSAQKQQQDIRRCERATRMLERCLRGKTEELLKASQPQVFRPSASI